jgi:hypothetical protein
LNPVPGTRLGYKGVSGRPVPALICVEERPLFERRAAPSVEQRSAMNTYPGGVLSGKGQQLALIERRKAALRAEVEPVLRDYGGTLSLPPSEESSIAFA